MSKLKTPKDIWDNKNIKPEAKEIYSYLYCRGFDRTVFHFDIGDIQKYIPITNVGFRNNLKILEKLKLLIYKEYKRGMYEIHIC